MFIWLSGYSNILESEMENYLAMGVTNLMGNDLLKYKYKDIWCKLSVISSPVAALFMGSDSGFTKQFINKNNELCLNNYHLINIRVKEDLDCNYCGKEVKRTHHFMYVSLSSTIKERRIRFYPNCSDRHQKFAYL